MVDKYCVGGFLGNCISFIVVVICVVVGLLLFKILLCVIMLLVGIVDMMEMFICVNLIVVEL